MQSMIQIHEKDNVAVALKALLRGDTIAVGEKYIQCNSNIAKGHKIALCDLEEGTDIIKYGHVIGHATCKISAGDWVHIHNMKTNLGEIKEYTYSPVHVHQKEEEEQLFLGYKRPNGTVGIRNELWIIPTVGCVNGVVNQLAKMAQHLKSEQIEDVIAFTHPYGCSQMGQDQDNTRKILADLALHPNAGGVLIVGLGCENSGIETILPYLGDFDQQKIQFMVCQDIEDEFIEGMNKLEQLALYANTFHREQIGMSKLIVGLKCGGSDGLSGITANPLVGRFSDVLVAQGGTTILTEVPEMFGAETILMNRCENEETFQQTVELINDFKEYYIKNGQSIYENPSPGNKAGGISTLEDKSLGCTQKSGDAFVQGVYGYGERVCNNGLNLLSAPGNDLVAATALAASGAHIILFTTGRGTPFASPVPTIKISTNTELAVYKKNWIDFDAGSILEEGSFDKATIDLFQYICDIASGRRTKSEEAGFHDIAIFKQGVTL